MPALKKTSRTILKVLEDLVSNCNYRVIETKKKCMLLTEKQVKGQWIRTGDQNKSHSYSYLITNKGGKGINWRKARLVDRW